jgi:hypothetical protein
MSTNVLSQRPKKKTPVGKPAPVQAVDEEKRGWSSMFGGLFSTADDTSDPASPAALPTVRATRGCRGLIPQATQATGEAEGVEGVAEGRGGYVRAAARHGVAG